MQKNIFIMFSLLIIFQVANIFFVNDLPIELEMMHGDKKFPAFETKFFDDEVATEKIFVGKVTALILWTTRTENSFELLHEIDSEQKNLPANIQVIGLYGEKNFSEAKKVADKFFPTLRQLKVNDDFYPVISKIKIVPTAIFIDERGILIGQPVGGDWKFILRELKFILEKDSPRSHSLIKIQNIILNR